MNEEQSIVILSFTGALKRETMRVKNQLAKLEDISEFKIEIEISGRVSQGDIKIEYKLSSGTYAGDVVSGNDLVSLTEEFLRRKGWKARHQPILLTVSEQNFSDSDKPFKGEPDDSTDL